MIKGNKGEWSEIYTLFKLLGDRELYLGDKDLEKLKGIVYPIIKVLRTERKNNFEYTINDELIIISGNQEVIKVPIGEFKEKAEVLLQAIKSNEKGTFEIPLIEQFMQSIKCLSLKAGSTTKTDITLIVHDQRTNQQPTLGFSVKSQLGNPSTLLNAGKTTNFIFKIKGVNLSSSQINNINKIDSKSKIKDRLELIKEAKGSLEFIRNEKQIFANNLILIDSKLPEILAEVVDEFYSSNKSSIKDLVLTMQVENPLGFDNTDNHKFYEFKVKRFLTDIALGMMPSKVWTGDFDATGGYLIVKENGDVLCYHIYNRNEFENYLFNNTKLETASSTRHQFGSIYKENEELFIKLNLQIRFIK